MHTDGMQVHTVFAGGEAVRIRRKAERGITCVCALNLSRRKLWPSDLEITTATLLQSDVHVEALFAHHN